MSKSRPSKRRIRVNGRQRQHSHYIWWKTTGCWPVWPEVIHHKNFDEFDDRFSNLELMSNSEHSSLHNSSRPPASEETKTKLREAWTSERRDEMSVRMTDRVVSKETRDKISENNSMRRPEVRAKITGNKNGRYGKSFTHTEESKVKMRGKNHPRWQGEEASDSAKRKRKYRRKKRLKEIEERKRNELAGGIK